MIKRARRTKSEFPITITRGSVRVKIYRIMNRGRMMFTVAYRGPNGKRMRSTLSVLSAAKSEAERIATRIMNGESAALELSNTDRSIYVRATELLSPTGRQLDVAVAEMMEAVDVLRDKGTLLEAARFFARHHAVGIDDRCMEDIYREFLIAKETDGLGVRYLQDCKNRLKKFADAFPRRISDCTANEMQDWLVGLKNGARARNNMRGLIVTLFNFAKQRGYLPKDRQTDADFLTRAKSSSGEIGILRPADLSKMLTAADPFLVPYLTIGAFAGLRQAELMRLEWQDVDLEQGHIQIHASKSKTGQRRLVPIHPNLMQWLQTKHPITGRLYSSPRTLRKVTTLAKGLGIEWPNNALRHSYASYRIAQCKNAAEVAHEMGNSPRMVFQHYRELVTPAEAHKWWTICPRKGGKIGKASAPLRRRQAKELAIHP